MNHSNFDLLLKSFSRYIELTEEEIQLFTSRLVVKQVKKGAIILKAGDLCTHSSFINKGLARVYMQNPEGQETTNYFAFEGWWANDVLNYTNRTPACKSIEILEDSEIFQLSITDFEQSFIDIPKFERFWRIVGENSYAAHNKRVQDFQLLTAEQRYTNLIEKFPAIELRVKQKHIASYLGIAPESLSVIRKKLLRR